MFYQLLCDSTASLLWFLYADVYNRARQLIQSVSRDVCNTGDPRQQAPLFVARHLFQEPTVLRFWFLYRLRERFPSLPSDRNISWIAEHSGRQQDQAENARKPPTIFPAVPGVFVFFFIVSNPFVVLSILLLSYLLNAFLILASS